MFSNREMIELVDVLLGGAGESEWLEFKSNYLPNQEIGEYISALSNGASLKGRPFGYLIFGIDDVTHEVTGTKYNYHKQKQGGEDLEIWLTRSIYPKISLNIYEVNYSSMKNLVIFEIQAAFNQPTTFLGNAYIRIGSHKQDLKKHPEAEKQLWNVLETIPYEQKTSTIQNLHFKEMTYLSQYKGIEFTEDKFPALRMLDENGKFNNLALLLSDENPHIVKFAVYKNEKFDFSVKKEFTGSWVAMLDQVLEYVDLYNDTSAHLVSGDPTRKETRNYPEPSLREIVVNAFAHFDPAFNSDIKIELFQDRVEIASPGSLYKTTMREILSGRQSFRNPNLINVLSKFKFIENYATGIRKTEIAYKNYDVKPEFVPTDNFFLVTLPNVNIGRKTVSTQSNKKQTLEKIKDKRKNAVEDPMCKMIIFEKTKNPEITTEELSQKLSTTKRTVQRKLKALRESGYMP